MIQSNLLKRLNYIKDSPSYLEFTKVFILTMLIEPILTLETKIAPCSWDQIIQTRPVVGKVDDAVHLDKDLPGGYRYPTFEQLQSG